LPNAIPNNLDELQAGVASLAALIGAQEEPDCLCKSLKKHRFIRRDTKYVLNMYPLSVRLSGADLSHLFGPDEINSDSIAGSV
jgi:hypothetical protein